MRTFLMALLVLTLARMTVPQSDVTTELNPFVDVCRDVWSAPDQEWQWLCWPEWGEAGNVVTDQS